MKYFFVILPIIFSSCDIMDSRKLKITNNTNDTLFCFWLPMSYFSDVHKSPLSGSYRRGKKDSILEKSNTVLFPGETNQFSDYNWETTLKHSEENKLFVFFFSLSTLKKFTWDTLRKNNLYDRRISLTLDSLQKKHWKIVLYDIQ